MSAFITMIYFILFENITPDCIVTFLALFRSTFEDAVDSFEDGSIDLLHIDGCHTYEAVKNDFQLYQSKLSSRAVVIFHDTQVKAENFGVWKFWEEISKDHPSFEFTNSHGLGVLVTGIDAPSAVKELTQLSGSERELVRTIFSSAGEKHVLQTKWKNENAEKEAILRQVSELRSRCTTLENELENIQGSNSWKITGPLRKLITLYRTRTNVASNSDASES